MTTTQIHSKKVMKLLTLAPLFALALSLAACSSDDSPTAPTGGNSSKEPILYEIQIDLDEIKINGDCDKDPLIGDGGCGMTLTYTAKEIPVIWNLPATGTPVSVAGPGRSSRV